jgi:hypothetical protein
MPLHDTVDETIWKGAIRTCINNYLHLEAKSEQ